MMSIIDATVDAKHPSWARIPIRMAQIVVNQSHPPVFRTVIRSYGGVRAALCGADLPGEAAMIADHFTLAVSLVTKLPR